MKFGNKLIRDKKAEVWMNWKITLIIIGVILILGAVYYLIFSVKACDTKECFEKAILNCKRVSWMRQDEQAAWNYKIIGRGEESCTVEVSLLKLNKGKIDSEKLIGKEMTCDLIKGSTDFPEKDISRCHGVLKEEMQDVIIQRMHDYLLQNVGKLEEGLDKI